MNKYKVVVPNLARREDRWLLCLGALLSQHVPEQHIERFIAHDGDNYPDYESARIDALKTFPGSRYLRDTRLHRHYYCWSWTWYEIMHNIATEPDDAMPTLILIDDHIMRLNYKQICTHVTLVYQMRPPFKMIQYVYSGQVPPGQQSSAMLAQTHFRSIGYTGLKHGFANSGDFANLISPIGARDILKVANNPNRPNIGVPNWVFWYAAREIDLSGCYSATRVQAFPSNQSRFVNSFEDGRNSF